jgi:uncharacterized membrane protein YhaH (DUF805 family)
MVVGGVNPGMMTGRPAQMMGFVDAVKNALQNNYVNFSGRASRSEYWWFYLFTIIASVGFLIPLMILAAISDTVAIVGFVIYMLVIMGLFLPSIGIQVRRLHDLGKSGWWYFIILIPCVGVILYIVWMVTDGEPHDNAYGPVPTNVLAQ